MAIHTDADKELKKGSFGYSDIYLFKFMFSYMKQYKKELILTGFFIVLYSIFTVIAPIILGNALNFFIDTNSYSIFGINFFDDYVIEIINWLSVNHLISLFLLQITALAGIYLFVQVLTFISAYLQNIIIGKVGLKATKKIREDLFEHLQELDMSYHDKNEVGRIMSRLTGDVEAIQQFFGGSIIENIMNLFTVITLAVVIVFIDPFLAIISYSLIPVILFLSSLQKQYTRPLHKESRRTNSILMAYLGESIQGMKVTKGMNREQKSEEKFRILNHDKRNADLKANQMNIHFFSVMLLIQSISVALIVLFGGLRYIEGTITAGIILAFLNYNLILFRPVMILGNFYDQLQNALTGAERISALLDTPTKVPNNVNFPKLDDIKGEITFKDITFEYLPNKPVYQNFSLHVPAGTKIAIVGHTGAGKTTIVNILSRMYKIQRGQLLIDGVDVNSISQPSYKSQIAVVPQDFFLFSTSLRNNLLLGKPDATDEEIWNVLELVNMRKFVQRLPEQLDTLMQERGGRLSIGQRQLIIFAAVLLANPKVVVLDEATSSVDVFSEILIQKALELVLKGRTSFIIAHRLSTIRDADKILVIELGKIVEQGTHEELLNKHGFYYELVKNQVDLAESAINAPEQTV
jgi:ATP-binding cassette subfamily B protein